jgi:phospholipid/cholesterol/gamma-HCH transport system substrate-binding protein
MKRSVVETILGAVVLFGAGVFLFYSYTAANVKKVTGYQISADFSGIGGLAVGDDVQISGVKVGSIASVTLDSRTYLAHVVMSIKPDVKLSDDTTASISSKSLLGGLYLSLEPGSSEDMLKNGGHIQYTQAPQNLEQLLGKFIFNMQKNNSGGSGGGDQAAASTPGAPAPAQAPAAGGGTPPGPASAQEAASPAPAQDGGDAAHP